MVLELILWMVFRPQKSHPAKKQQKVMQKTSSKTKTQAIVKSLVNTEQKFQAMSL